MFFCNAPQLNAGDYFNVGESMEGLYVISNGRVEVVQVATLAFARHSDRLKNLSDMKAAYLSKVGMFNKHSLSRMTNAKVDSEHLHL